MASSESLQVPAPREGGLEDPDGLFRSTGHRCHFADHANTYRTDHEHSFSHTLIQISFHQKAKPQKITLALVGGKWEASKPPPSWATSKAASDVSGASNPALPTNPTQRATPVESAHASHAPSAHLYLHQILLADAQVTLGDTHAAELSTPEGTRATQFWRLI